jgi:hypothetical protein
MLWAKAYEHRRTGTGLLPVIRRAILYRKKLVNWSADNFLYVGGQYYSGV